MSAFGIRKPRGFHHNFIYVDERRDRLNDMEKRAKRELGMTSHEDINPEDLRGTFVNATRYLKKRKKGMAIGRKSVGTRMLIVFIIILAALWYFLSM